MSKQPSIFCSVNIYIYYLITILISLTGLVVYVVAARRYKYRQRDKPDNVYRYAEDYYSKHHDDDDDDDEEGDEEQSVSYSGSYNDLQTDKTKLN